MLEHLDLSLPDRGLVFIHGRSGSGKSTLLSIIGGFLEPSSGSIEGSPGPCSLVIQESTLIDGATVFDNAALGLTVRGVREKERERVVEETLEKLGISSLSGRKASDLSGGERQRVAVAAAMIAGGAILADEPTGALDAANARELMSVLKDCSRDRLVVVVSHDIELVEGYADTSYRLDNRRLHTEKRLPLSVVAVSEEPREKGRIRFGDRLKLAWSLVKGKTARLLVSALTAGFSFAALAVAVSAGSESDSFARNVTSSFFTQDTLVLSETTVIQQTTGMSLVQQSELSDKTVSALEEEIGAAVEPSLSYYVPSSFEIDLGTSYFDCTVDPFFSASTSIEGIQPTSYDGVIANRSLADSMGISSEMLIGKRFTVETERTLPISTEAGTEYLSYSERFTFRVQGVAEENTAFNNPAIYYSYDLMREYLEPIELEGESELTIGDTLTSSGFRGTDVRGYQSVVRIADIHAALEYLETREDILCVSRIGAASSSAREISSSIASLSTIFLVALSLIAVAIEVFTLSSILVDTRPECAVLLTLSRDRKSFRRSISGVGTLFAIASAASFAVSLLVAPALASSILSGIGIDIGAISIAAGWTLLIGGVLVLISLIVSSILVSRIRKSDLFAYLRTDR